jgi:threonine dehydrogenase-like Zn-dependent dehydrogenase
MSSRRAKRVIISGPQHIDIEGVDVDMADVAPYEVVVNARRSVISPGTELSRYRDQVFGGVAAERPSSFPAFPGYAMVGDVVAAGEKSGLKEGMTVLSFTPHQSIARFDCRETVCVLVPEGLSLDVAPFARLAKVGGISLQASAGRPGDVVAVLGLGPIGNLAAQLAASSGFVVVAVEARPERREVARQCGLTNVVAVEDAKSALSELGGARVVLECSGRAAGALLGTELCALHGEVMTVGAPWVYEPAVAATSVLTRVFSGFLSLRSGWELQFPKYDGGGGRSIASVTGWAFQKLKDGSLKTAPLVSACLPPEEAASAYKLLDEQPERHMTFLLDWEAS